MNCIFYIVNDPMKFRRTAQFVNIKNQPLKKVQKKVRFFISFEETKGESVGTEHKDMTRPTCWGESPFDLCAFLDRFLHKSPE